MTKRLSYFLALGAMLMPGCAPDGQPVTGRWAGSMDTLPSGQIRVRNTADPLWQPGMEWQVVEELRIGSRLGEGPSVFGRVESFAVDGDGNIWILDEIARELRVFDPSGSYLRTVGGPGRGPGEFLQPVDVELAPDNKLWVVDVGAMAISVLDPSGRYIERRPIPTGVKMWPWRGGFDKHGHYYAPVGAAAGQGEMFAYTLVRHDSALTTIDTLERPRDPVRRETYEFRGVIATIPLQGGLRWWLSREGTVWAIVWDQYRLFELSWSGDTLRTITRAFKPLPVTERDREELRSAWRPYVEGGQPEWWSRLPRTKPPVTGFAFLDEERNIWVEQATEDVHNGGSWFDVFDREGRFLGPVRLPFALDGPPVTRSGYLYGVTLDDLDVPYLVKARIIKGHI